MIYEFAANEKEKICLIFTKLSGNELPIGGSQNISSIIEPSSIAL